MTIKEAAQKFQCSESKISYHIANGRIKAEKVGNRYILPDDVEVPSKKLCGRKKGQKFSKPRPPSPEELKRREYIRNLGKYAVTPEQKNHAFIMQHECNMTVNGIALHLKLSCDEVLRIYDQELENIERVLAE